MKYIQSIRLFTALTFLPVFTHAASVTPPRNFSGLVDLVIDILQSLIVLTFALTFLVFAWQIVKSWIIDGGNAESVEEGKKVVVTGIIVLVIMSSVWAIVYLIQSSFFGAGV
jgi:hypothetical protein